METALKEENGTIRSKIVGIVNFGHNKIDEKLCSKLPSLKVVSNIGAGVDHIAVEELRRAGINVGHTPGILSETTAELAFALMIASCRRLAQAHIFCGSKNDSSAGRDIHGFMGQDLAGKTVGIVGMGSIGKEIAKRCSAFDMDILYYNRSQLAAEEEKEAGSASYCKNLESCLKRADFLFLVVPLNPKTKGLISSKQLAMMKPTAHLINIARGEVVDTDDLTSALQKGEISAAALDVTAPEPLPEDHKLRSMENVILTPHIGSATLECRLRMAWMALDNLMAAVKGQAMVRTPGTWPEKSEVQKLNREYRQKVANANIDFNKK